MVGDIRRYKIISKGEQLPEAIPNVGDRVQLQIRQSKGTTASDGDPLEFEVGLEARYVHRWGERYVRLSGLLDIAGWDDVPGVAIYEHGQHYAAGTLIGELTVYWSE